jgi:hypothetical protein
MAAQGSRSTAHVEKRVEELERLLEELQREIRGRAEVGRDDAKT